MTILVTVHLHTVLQDRVPDGPLRQIELEVQRGCTLGDIIRMLNIEIDPADTLLVINNRTAGLDQLVADGDQVHLIPALSGG